MGEEEERQQETSHGANGNERRGRTTLMLHNNMTDVVGL